MIDTKVQQQRAVRFRALHDSDRPLQLTNAWDATSARILAATGACAIGTTNFGVALNNGMGDGEQVPFATTLEVAASVVAAVDVPVSIDIEAGHGVTPTDVGQSVAAIIATGAVGINIEDGIPGRPGDLFDVAEQSERIAAARAAADRTGIPLFINARCDVYFGANVPTGDRVDEVLKRAESYRAVGADGLFLPGLLDPATIKAVTAQVDLPVNIMVGTGSPPLADLVAAGVRRVSQGGEPFLALVGMLKQLTERYLSGELASPPDALGAGASLLKALVA